MSSVSSALKTWFTRATRSRLTIAFFLVVFVNYAAQMALHIMVSSNDLRIRALVTSTIDAAGVQRGFTVVRNGVLEICSGIPSLHGTTCYTVYNSSAVATPASSLGMQCAEGLTWLENYLSNFKGEEAVYIALESWLVVISLVGLVEESVPNMIVLLIAQIVNTGWLSYRLASGASAKVVYNEVVVKGSCGGVDILEGSWQYDMFYMILVLSIAALLVMSFFVFKLINLYSNATLSSVGSPPLMTQMLRWRLWMRVFNLFTSFFILAAVAIWYGKRKSGTVAPSFATNTLYDVGFYVVIIIVLPWAALGAYSITKENHHLFLVYALLSTCLLVMSGLWFGSALFLYEFMTWRTFAWMTTMADVLLVITCVLSVICRLNFGKGLAHFLVVERELQDSGFACDTFQNCPFQSKRASVNVKRVTILSPPEPVYRSTLRRPRPSFRKSKYTPSICSVETAMFASWLSPAGDRGQEKRKPIAAQEGWPAGTIIVSAEDMGLDDTHSNTDNESGSSLDEMYVVVF